MPTKVATAPDTAPGVAAPAQPSGLRLHSHPRAPSAQGATYVPTHQRPITWDTCPEPRHLLRHGKARPIGRFVQEAQRGIPSAIGVLVDRSTDRSLWTTPIETRSVCPYSPDDCWHLVCTCGSWVGCARATGVIAAVGDAGRRVATAVFRSAPLAGPRPTAPRLPGPHVEVPRSVSVGGDGMACDESSRWRRCWGQNPRGA
jgi:hypothetical protein